MYLEKIIMQILTPIMSYTEPDFGYDLRFSCCGLLAGHFFEQNRFYAAVIASDADGYRQQNQSKPPCGIGSIVPVLVKLKNRACSRIDLVLVLISTRLKFYLVNGLSVSLIGLPFQIDCVGA